MARQTYLPTKGELAEKLNEISQLKYNGIRTPTINVYNDYRPPGWASGKSLLQKLGYSETINAKAEDWQKLVVELTGIEPVDKYVKHPAAMEKLMNPDDDDAMIMPEAMQVIDACTLPPDGLAVSSVREVGNEVYYMLR
jgi:hypothetical protein